MILDKPILYNVSAPIAAGIAAVTILLPGMDRFPLRMWRGTLVTDQKYDLSTAAKSMLPRADELAVRGAKLDKQVNAIAEFANLLAKEIARDLPPLLKINNKINIITVSS